jgi:hypothetical protein
MALTSDQWRIEDGKSAVGAVETTGLLHRYLLVLRFALVNIIAIGLLAAVLLQGWLAGALVDYTMWLSLGIFGVFLFGMILCGAKIWRTSVELNDVRAGTPRRASGAGKYLGAVHGYSAESRSIIANSLRLRMNNYISIVRQIANTLVFLGLVGTVIGFIFALSGVNPELSATVDNIAPMVATLIEGMSIALYTTLIGAVLHVWLMINHGILVTGTVHLFSAIVELGERRVGS